MRTAQARQLTHIDPIENWFEELKAKVPGAAQGSGWTVVKRMTRRSSRYVD